MLLGVIAMNSSCRIWGKVSSSCKTAQPGHGIKDMLKGFLLGVQEFMQGAGEQGVLLIALGTVTETSEPCSLLCSMPAVFRAAICGVAPQHGAALHSACLRNA